jgi:pimeloyl-ACP methyl ester carboxylesterase
MRKALKWLAGAALALAVAYVGYASWQVAGLLDKILRVGSPIAQGEGMPPPERPEDIGYAGDAKAAFGYDFEDVSLPAELGPTPAWLIPSGAEGRTWAIFVHGIGGRRENGYRFLPVLHEAGLPTLMIAYRNDPEGPAAPNGLYGLGLTEWRDLEVAVQVALDRGAGNVVLVAESMGGAIVGQFLQHSTLAGRIKAVVLDAPMIDLASTLSALVGRLGVPVPKIVARGALRITTFWYDIDLTRANVMDTLAGYSGPLFLSHGAGDRIVPVATSDRLAAARSGRTEYLRTGADHILSWKVDAKRYEDALRKFLASLSPS